MIWTKIKLYVYSAIGLLVAGMVARIKYLAAKAKREEKRADIAQAGLNQSIEILQKDSELDDEFKSRKAKEAAQIEAKNASDELSDPNAGWLRDDNGTD